MTNAPNNDSNNKSIHRRAKAWDGFLAKEAEIVHKSESNFGRSKVKFDGGTERDGVSESEIKNRIASCREAYENVGIIGNIIDLMSDFGVEGIEIYHKSKPIEKFFKQWAKKVKLRELSEQILKCIYRDGNVPVLSLTGKIDQNEIEKFRRSFGKEKSTNSLFEDKATPSSRIIPYKYKILDALSIYRTGNSILGNDRWSYQYNQSDCKELIKMEGGGNNSKEIKKIKDAIGLDAWEKLKTKGLYDLDPNKFSMLFYKKDGYRCWANPMLWRVMGDIKFKKLIRDMDISVAEGVTSAVTIVKLGDTAAGLPPSKNKYTKMVSMMKNPSKSKTIVWDDLISLETDYPPVKDFFSAEKYKQVDDDIRSGLGVAEILVNGGGGNYSNSYLSVKTLLERLETGRSILLEFLNEQIELVTKNMGFRNAPHIKLTNMSLANEETEKKFILELFDRNALSYETMVSRFGENLEIEVSRMSEEAKIRESEKEDSPFALLRVGKFGPQYPNGPPTIVEIADIEQNNLPSSQEQNGRKGGSPTGPKNRREVTEEPARPVGETAASCSTYSYKEIDEAFDFCYESAKNHIFEEKKYKDARSLKSEDIDSIIKLVTNSVPSLLLEKSKDDKFSKTEAPEKLDRCVRQVTKQEVENYIKQNGRRPSKEALREITQKAFAVCKTSLGDKD